MAIEKQHSLELREHTQESSSSSPTAWPLETLLNFSKPQFSHL